MDDNFFNRFVSGAIITVASTLVIGIIAAVICAYRDGSKSDRKSMLMIGLLFLGFFVVATIVGYSLPGNWL